MHQSYETETVIPEDIASGNGPILLIYARHDETRGRYMYSNWERGKLLVADYGSHVMLYSRNSKEYARIAMRDGEERMTQICEALEALDWSDPPLYFSDSDAVYTPDSVTTEWFQLPKEVEFSELDDEIYESLLRLSEDGESTGSPIVETTYTIEPRMKKGVKGVRLWVPKQENGVSAEEIKEVLEDRWSAAGYTY